MPWNNGGDGPSNPWGQPGGSGSSGAGGGTSPRPPQRPGGNGSGDGGGGPRGGPPRGPWGGGPPPDLDETLARAWSWARRSLPGGPSGRGPRSPLLGSLGGGRGVALIGLGVLAVWLATGFYRVQPDQQGVVLRFGAFNRTTLPGLNYHLPWPIESALTPAVTRINRTEVGFRSQQDTGPTPFQQARFQSQRDPNARDITEEALMLTGDENIVDINFSVFWRISDAGAYLFATRNPSYTVKSAAESVMREVVGRTPIQPALTEARARIEQSVMTGTQAILDAYHAGVEITQVQLQKVDPPAAVIDSFRDVQRANTDAERLRNEAESYRNDVVPRARGDAARLVADAEATRQSLIAEATGQAQRFLSVYRAYEASKDVTLRRLYIETMQEILTRTPTVVVDDSVRGLVPFLPLGDMNRAAGTAASDRPASPSPLPQPVSPGSQPARSGSNAGAPR